MVFLNIRKTICTVVTSKILIIYKVCNTRIAKICSVMRTQVIFLLNQNTRYY